MAIAGPAVSAALAWSLWFVAGLVPAPAAALPLKHVAAMNLLLLVFNLVPAFPLDGGRVLRSALWGAMGDLRRATRWAAALGQAFAMLLIGLGLWCIFTGRLFQGLWLSLIGMYLNNAARGGYEQVLVRQLLKGEPVGRFMTRNPIVVPPTLDLDRWVEDYVFRHHRRQFPVATDGRLDGVIATEALARYPRAEWRRRTVAEAMDTDVAALTIPGDADALQALGRMQRTGAGRLLVTEGGRLVGVVSLKDLLQLLDLKAELGSVEA
jgi:CBS domain-containing protein